MDANHWDERYRQGEYTHSGPLEFLAHWLPGGHGRRALDLACGAGRHALLMAERGWQVTAVDSSEAALGLFAHPGIEKIAADLKQFEIRPNHWELICVTFYMQRDLFEPIRDGIVPGGLLAAAFPLVDERPGVRPMRREFLVGPGELRGLFEERFEIIHEAETQPPPPQRGTAELWARRRKS